MVLAILLLCLVALPGAAGAATAGSSPDTSSVHPWLDLEYSVPLPTADASRKEIGMDAGLSLGLQESHGSRIGIDVAYHYWPVSTEFKDSFNERLRNGTLNTLELGGDTWRLKVLQFTVDLTLAAPHARVLIPWLKVGAGLYWVDPNTTGYSGNAGFFTVTAGPLKHGTYTGYCLTTGVDLPGANRPHLGVLASFHDVACADYYGQDLRVFSVGAHVLFGR